MLSAQLSPWTMAWFGMALMGLLLSLCLALTGAIGPGDWARAAGLSVVHLFTLGWLGLMMLGALIQFVPVLTAQPLSHPAMAMPALLATASGVAALAIGFLGLDGHVRAELAFLAAPWLLLIGFGLVLAMILPPLCTRASLHLSEVRMVLLALIALVALWGSGTMMLLELSGQQSTGFLPDGLPLHILFGIGGWLSLAAFGVSYKLFAMFLLAPEAGHRLRRMVFLAACLALSLLLAVLMALTVSRAPSGLWLALPLPLVTGLYLAEIARLWRLRRRTEPEGNMVWSRVALAFLAIAALMALPAFAIGGTWAEAAIFAALTGWLSLLTLAQMVKITSFLTWIQVFASRIGRGPVPLVQDLTDPRITARWLALWSGGAAVGTASLLLALPVTFRLSLAALLLAALGLAHELLSIRRLSHLSPMLRPVHRPPVLFPPLKPGATHDRPL